MTTVNETHHALSHVPGVAIQICCGTGVDMSASNMERQVDIPLASGSEQEMSEALARNWWAIALRAIPFI